MWLLDVNVLVDAHRRESRFHDEIHGWLHAHLTRGPPLGITMDSAVGFLRIVTNSRIYRQPDTPAQGLAFLDALAAAGAAWLGVDAAMHRELHRQVLAIEARAADVPDAAQAAQAVALGATIATRDRGFARFPGLSWIDPLEGVVHQNPQRRV